MSKKYILKDELESDFDLIAIHSSIEGFYLAYLLNRTLEGNFIRVANDEVLTSSDFEFFKWEIKKKGIHCTLISNEKTIKLKKSNSPLFFFEETKKVSLINSSKNGLVIIIKLSSPQRASCSICLIIIGVPPTSSNILVESFSLKPWSRVPNPPAAITVFILFTKFIIELYLVFGLT